MADGQQRQMIALKEWAVSVKALREGEQILVLRKGGIVEETRDFQLISPNFYLMPAYEHQRRKLLKEKYRDGMDETLKEWSTDMDRIKLDAYAEVTDDIEINDQETLDKLRDRHIWTDAFAEERLKWKRKKPLHLLLMKIFVLEEPVYAPMRDAYNGCKSWVRLEDGIGEPPMTPVLTREMYEAERKRILSLIDLKQKLY